MATHDQRTRPFGIHNPVGAAIAGGLAGFVVMAAVLLSVGYLLTHMSALGSITAWDTSVNRWFVTIRTSTLDMVTSIGSMLGATLTVVGIAVLAGVGLAIAKRWRAVGFLAVGLVIEVSVFLTTAILIDRPRPSVPRLDVAPPTSSFPSGHTAAAIVLYVGLAIILSSLTRSMILRIGAWTFAVALPIFVALSRLYRGMHHPTDVIGSVILGAGALLFAHLAVGTIREQP